MRESPRDTIVAAATAPGRGGVAIVRLSGEAVPRLLAGLLGEKNSSLALASPRTALYAAFQNGSREPIDQGLALYFPAPGSYTGEPVLELHAHGGPIIVEQLIARALELGARRARAGEFTERAYLHGKLDLAQAEAVASLIDAASVAAARAALRSLDGEFSRQILELAERIGALRAFIEASIDFVDEQIDFLSDPQLSGRLRELEQTLAILQVATRRGRALTEGLQIVIAGRPNAGKSTLLNRLAGHDAAIVTPEPGTTRDILRERIVLDGLPLTLLDTAGLRAAGPAGAADPIEREGMRRAREAMHRADRILFVIDAASDPQARAWREERGALPAGIPVTLVRNKSDLAAPITDEPAVGVDADPPSVRVSALTGAGFDALAAHLRAAVGLDELEGGVISARARHVEAIARVATHIGEARALLDTRRTPELIAEELRQAQQALGEIVGEESNEALLGRIFSAFCIGK